MDLREDALRFYRSASEGALATHSADAPGYPFASWARFRADERGDAIFLFSALAQHACNLAADARASLLVSEPSSPRQDGDLRRLTLVGEARRLSGGDAETARRAYLDRFPGSARYLELPDFSFWRLVPMKARYIGGFGKAIWISGEEFKKAAAATL
jgi:heme iron utilization protein